MQWKTVLGFGQTHLMLPTGTVSVCGYRPNVRVELGTTRNLAKDVNCVECLHFAQVMQIPTAILGK